MMEPIAPVGWEPIASAPRVKGTRVRLLFLDTGYFRAGFSSGVYVWDGIEWCFVSVRGGVWANCLRRRMPIFWQWAT
jgi:hypothetical protein